MTSYSSYFFQLRKPGEPFQNYEVDELFQTSGFLRSKRSFLDIPPSIINSSHHLEYILYYDFCDGFPDCTIYWEDELDPRCNDRFRCQAENRISIAPSEVCDGTINCDDGSDEWRQICPQRFYCNASRGAKVTINADSFFGGILKYIWGVGSLNPFRRNLIFSLHKPIF